MTCKDCIYYKVCADFRRNICEADKMRFEEYRVNSDGLCCNFKDKSRFVELPCKVGDKAAVRALCECVITTPCYEECRHICPFENDCERDECSSLNERIFDTKVAAIYDNGNGWCIEFDHLIIQARFADIGTSFFIGENAHEQAVAYNKGLAEREGEG